MERWRLILVMQGFHRVPFLFSPSRSPINCEMFFRFRASDRGRGGGVECTAVGSIPHFVGLLGPPPPHRLCRRRRQLNSVCNACAKMEDNFDPGTARGPEEGEKKGACETSWETTSLSSAH